MQIISLLRAPFLVRRFIRNDAYQERFLRKKLGPLLDTAVQEADGSVDAADLKKIYQYYGLAVPAILGEELAVLRGQSLSERERLALTYQGAMTGLFDDFFDRHDMPEEELFSIVKDPGSHTGRNANERLFLQLYTHALAYSANADLTRAYLLKVYHAQVESLRQLDPLLEPAEIKRITIDKGGVSVLFYRSALSHTWKQGEEEALYHMGGLMQLGNDVFDIYKDAPQHIRTLPTISQQVSALKASFRGMQAEVFNRCRRLPYRSADIRLFLDMVSLSLCARCEVCFDQLEALEKRSGRFDVHAYTKQELVCDLDGWRNKLRSLRYHVMHTANPDQFVSFASKTSL